MKDLRLEMKKIERQNEKKKSRKGLGHITENVAEEAERRMADAEVAERERRAKEAD